ncbi:MAG: hypothetical protein U1G08_12125 [Verrucomicrobiota bacterium]
MKHRPAWRRKRFLIPVFLFGVLVLGAGVAFLRSDASSVVLYNHTGAVIPAVRVVACGHSATCTALGVDDSWRWKPSGGSESDIALEIATEPPTRWEGGRISPKGGYRITLHLWPGGEVEYDSQISIWRRAVGGTVTAEE